ncbi:carbon monoxide dehydrogenase [Actinomadura sp. LD22]|uniref:Carbon monoxide dehydrogenase n=1 Tax=Actinomadura physcomitrii TaxID=2650748 RepID=A0A6I4M774_9ACTN|nr:SRPBCC family protein [Actinomadura physcomitrii]MWA01623.1 carbon monoxide dehydrogenase [Actinomadura physcomitrii]
MELTNTFTVNLPVADAWHFLTDLERVAPCLPGASVVDVDGDEYRGLVKVKVGPVSVSYTGTARFVERDDKVHRAVIRAEGRDVGGQGNAAATVTATLAEQGTATLVSVRTQLALSGRAAQFGRGVIADISNKLLGQFVERLEVAVARSGVAQEAGTPPERPGPAVANGNGLAGVRGTGDLAVAAVADPAASDVEPLDLTAGLGGVLLRRALPAAGAVAAVAALITVLVAAFRRRPAVPAATLVINLPAAPVAPAIAHHRKGDR